MSQANYDQRTESNISSLQPDFADRVRQWLGKARGQGLNPYIHFGARSVAKQKELYQKHLDGGPQAVQPEHSYHCYGRAFDWVNIADPDGGDAGLAWDDDKAYAKGKTLANNYDIRGIGEADNDHLQDAKFPRFSDLPRTELGQFPSGAIGIA
jgi:hypothetical protein